MLEYIQMYPETFAMVKRYAPADRCLLYESMAHYAFTGEEPDWPEDDLKWLIWEALKQKVDNAQRFAEKQRNNGGKGGRPKPIETQDNPAEPNITPKSESYTESYTKSESYINTISCPTSGADKARETREMEARFNRFWTVYPRHSAKQNALKAFQKLKPDDDLLDTMIAAVEKQRASPQWTRDGGQYIPMPSTWINGRRWEDEVTVAPASAQSALRQVNAQMYQQREYADSDEMPEWLKRRIDAELAKAGKEAACTSA